MKQLYTLIIFSCTYFLGQAQNGLERIVVEKYYVSDLNDKSVDGDGGNLPIQSVTYRVYVDMLPGYIFQAAFGTPEHELRIATTTSFFNNEDRGARFPSYTRTQAQNNTVMLDSWLSVGAAAKDHYGVLKDHDDGINTIVNADGVLQNEDPEAGIPLRQEDGLMSGSPEAVTVVGFFDTDLGILDDANIGTSPMVISTFDGAWSSLNGSRGQDTMENIVLIGQFTTDGVFDFELNIQIRNQSTLEVEKYVARNPVGTEIEFPDLIHRDSLGVTGTPEIVNIIDNVKAFPNPVNEQLNVELRIDPVRISEHAIIQIQSLNGIPVHQQKVSGIQNVIDVSGLLHGAYILFIKLDDLHQASFEFIKI